MFNLCIFYVFLYWVNDHAIDIFQAICRLYLAPRSEQVAARNKEIKVTLSLPQEYHQR